MRTTIGYMLLLAICLSLPLVSCNRRGNTSGSSGGQEIGGNPHLLQGDDFIADSSLRARSYNTVALQPEQHAQLSSNGILTLPYEILRSADYKFCVPDGEGYKVSLEDGGGSALGRWEAGSCESITLEPGEYRLRVENTGNVPLFIKPQAVIATPVPGAQASDAALASRMTGTIADYVLLDLKKDTLFDLLGACTTNEYWAAWVDGTTYGKGKGYVSLYNLAISPAIAKDYFLSICVDGPDRRRPEDINVNISLGMPSSSSWKQYIQVFHQTEGTPTQTAEYDQLIYTNEPMDYWDNSLVLSDQGAGFKLGTRDWGTDPMKFLDWKSTQLGVDQPLTFTTSAGGIQFYPKLRYGNTTESQPIPYLLDTDIALFNQPFDKANRQFPTGTTYWIMNYEFDLFGTALLADLGSIGFDSPLGKVKSIIVGRGVRARFYAQPGYQPAETMEQITPPKNAELVYTSEDSDLLKKQIGSIFLEPNDYSYTDYEFEHHIIVSGACVRCDLRGFDGSGAMLTRVILSESNLEGADLSNAVLTNAYLEGCRFTRANLKAADLSGAFLHGASLDSAELSGADLSSAYLDAATVGSTSSPRTYARATLIGARMKSTRLNNAHAAGADFTRASWWGLGANGENAILDRAQFTYADLPGLDLKNASLAGALFTNAVLLGADLSGSDANRSFEGTNFVYANLKGTNLDGMNLQSANLGYASVYTTSTTSMAYVEVLADVLGAAPRYTYFAINFGATHGAVTTDNSTICPNSGQGWCGPIDDPADPAFKWNLPAGVLPNDPIDCTTLPDGTADCTSKRHPAN